MVNLACLYGHHLFVSLSSRRGGDGVMGVIFFASYKFQFIRVIINQFLRKVNVSLTKIKIVKTYTIYEAYL